MKVDKIHKPVVFRHLAVDHEVRWPPERWSVKEMNSYCLIPSWREFSGGSTGRRGLNRTQRSPWAEETKIKVARTCRAVTQQKRTTVRESLTTHTGPLQSSRDSWARDTCTETVGKEPPEKNRQENPQNLYAGPRIICVTWLVWFGCLEHHLMH